MEDAAKARRLRIANALMAVWFVCLAGVLALLARDIGAGVLGLSLFAVGYGVGVLFSDGAGLLPSGRLPSGHRRALQCTIWLAAAFGLAALIFATGGIDTAAVALAAVAAGAAITTGAFSLWLGVR